MGITTTYVCDLCGHEQDNPTQMWHVTVHIELQHYMPRSTPAVSQFWCRVCCERRHLLPKSDAVEAEAPPQPTMEDLVREIVREEIQEI